MTIIALASQQGQKLFVAILLGAMPAAAAGQFVAYDLESPNRISELEDLALPTSPDDAWDRTVVGRFGGRAITIGGPAIAITGEGGGIALDLSMPLTGRSDARIQRVVDPVDATEELNKLLAKLPQEKTSGEEIALAKALAEFGHQQYAKACAKAVDEMREKRRANIPPSECSLARDLERIRDYDESCLKRVDEIAPELRDLLLATVGVLIAKGARGTICTASVVGPRLLLTARHCVTYKDANLRYRLRAPSAMNFYLAATPAKAIAIEKVLPSKFYDIAAEAFEPGEDLHDFALLRTEDEISPPPGLAFGTASGLQRIVIPGFHPDVHCRQTEQDKALGQTPDQASGPYGWIRALRIDLSPSCAIAAVREGRCLLHSCQTEEGMSGAAIFDWHRNEIVGLHTRWAKENDLGRCGRNESTNNGPNIGLALPSEAMEAIIGPVAKAW